MSTPTRELEDLSIGENMAANPNRRVQGQQRRRDRERAERDLARATAAAGHAPGTPAAGDPTRLLVSRLIAAQPDIPMAGPSGTHRLYQTPGPVTGHTGLVYDIHQLSPHSRPRAAEGLHSDEFTVDFSMRKNSGGGFYYAFQLKKPISVRISDRSNESRIVTCTCDEFQASLTPCVHIFWLFDGLNYVLSDRSRSSTEVVTNANVLRRIAELYDQIGDHLDPATNRLDSLTKALNRTRGEDAATESDDIESETSSQAGDQDRTEWALQDMLSVFDERWLPEELGRQDFVENIPTDVTSLESLVNHENLVATIYGLARHDQIFRRRLRKALTKDFCAVQFLEKMRARIWGTVLGRLDRHITAGSRADPGIFMETADRLQGCVQQIQKYFEDRAPLSKQVRSMAAELVVDLLRSVCNRNKDTYTQIDRTRTTQDPEDEDDRNLFYNLIGCADEADEDDYFALTFLTGLAPHEWMHLSDRLNELLDRLRRYHAPRGYLEKLEGIVRAYETYPADPTRTVGERPPITGERESRRRRVA